jgi:hypothetical protein
MFMGFSQNLYWLSNFFGCNALLSKVNMPRLNPARVKTIVTCSVMDRDVSSVDIL